MGHRGPSTVGARSTAAARDLLRRAGPVRTPASEITVEVRLDPDEANRKLAALRAQASQTSPALAEIGDDATAAAPPGSLVLGAACSAPLAAAGMARRAGLLAGYVAGAVGAAVVVVGAAVASLPWLLAGNALLGAGNTDPCVSSGHSTRCGPWPAGPRSTVTWL